MTALPSDIWGGSDADPVTAFKPVDRGGVLHLLNFRGIGYDRSGQIFLNFGMTSNTTVETLEQTYIGVSFMIRFAGSSRKLFRSDVGDQFLCCRAGVQVTRDLGKRDRFSLALKARVGELEYMRGPIMPAGTIHLSLQSHRRDITHGYSHIEVPEHLIGADSSERSQFLRELLDRQRDCLY